MQLEDSTAHLYDSYIACTLRVVLKLLYMHTWKGLRCCSGSYQHKMSWVNVRASIHIRLSLKYCIRQWVLWVPGLWSSVLCYVLLLGWAFSLYHNIILSGLIVATPPLSWNIRTKLPLLPPKTSNKNTLCMYLLHIYDLDIHVTKSLTSRHRQFRYTTIIVNVLCSDIMVPGCHG